MPYAKHLKNSDPKLEAHPVSTKTIETTRRIPVKGSRKLIILLRKLHKESSEVRPWGTTTTQTYIMRKKITYSTWWLARWKSNRWLLRITGFSPRRLFYFWMGRFREPGDEAIDVLCCRVLGSEACSSPKGQLSSRIHLYTCNLLSIWAGAGNAKSISPPGIILRSPAWCPNSIFRILPHAEFLDQSTPGEAAWKEDSETLTARHNGDTSST